MNKLFLSALIFLLISSCNNPENKTEKIKNEEMQGIIYKKHKSWVSHYIPMISYKNQYIVSGFSAWDWGIEANELYNYIEIGDSISKPLGELNIQIIKPNGEMKTFPYSAY